MSPTTLAERYRLDELIAVGGMGSVYRAMDEHLGRPVAIKVLKRVLADDPMGVRDRERPRDLLGDGERLAPGQVAQAGDALGQGLALD